MLPILLSLLNVPGPQIFNRELVPLIIQQFLVLKLEVPLEPDPYFYVDTDLDPGCYFCANWTSCGSETLTITMALSTEHSASKLRVIGTNVHQFDSYLLHLTMLHT